MKDRLLDALRHSTADYADIRVSVDDGLHLAYRGQEAEHASAWNSAGGIVRACTKGGWGIITFDALDDLPRRVAEACQCARLIGRERTQLAPVPAVDSVRRAVLKRDFRGVSVDDKVRLVQAYNAVIIGAHKAVQSSHVGYEEEFRTVYFASTDGAYYQEERPRVSLRLSATARAGALVQHAYDGTASPDDYGAVLGWEAAAREIADRAVALLAAPKCAAGAASVVLDPRLAGVFAHEAFGHLSEADFLYENPRMRELMHLGREMGVAHLNIIDDGTHPGALGTHAFDDEGAPVTRVPLITRGVLTAHLHSRETAAKMNAQPSGNARACEKHHAPIVRMRNTFIENGCTPLDELFKGVDHGIYACDSNGGQTEFEMFTFSAAYGYRIEHGRKGELVRDIVLTGNVFETLKKIDAIGNDFSFYQNAGGCGKGGQSPLPVSFGSPHVRIRDVIVGGAQ